MIRLHYYPGNASLAPHILLRELAVPFELALVDRDQQAHKRSAYLKLNPNGLIPVLEDGDLVLYETVAILMHLADTHPATALLQPLLPPLLPPLGSDARAHAMKWLVWLGGTVQPTMSSYFYPERWVDQGNAEGASQVKRQSQQRMQGLLAQIDAQLAASSGPWLLGPAYSAADPLAFLMARWTRGFEGPACAPARDWPQIGPYLQRMLARPAVQQAIAAEGLLPPLV